MARARYPSDQDRYGLSFPPGMRDHIKQAARVNHRTMNAEIVYRLQMSFEQQRRDDFRDPSTNKSTELGA